MAKDEIRGDNLVSVVLRIFFYEPLIIIQFQLCDWLLVSTFRTKTTRMNISNQNYSLKLNI